MTRPVCYKLTATVLGKFSQKTIALNLALFDQMSGCIHGAAGRG
jgi:hypothetical protein